MRAWATSAIVLGLPALVIIIARLLPTLSGWIFASITLAYIAGGVASLVKVPQGRFILMGASVANIIAVVAVIVIQFWYKQDPSLDVQVAEYARAHNESYYQVHQQMARGKSVILMLGVLTSSIPVGYSVMMLRIMRSQ
jgi:hypothetical protein